jgi:hypothetical protein
MSVVERKYFAVAKDQNAPRQLNPEKDLTKGAV